MLRKIKNFFTEYRQWLEGLLIRVRLWAETPPKGGDEGA